MVQNQYLKQITYSTKLVNKKLLIFFKKYKHLEMHFAQTSWVKNIVIPNEKMLSTLALKGTGVLKNFTNKVIMWW